jgi:hypothetical protein
VDADTRQNIYISNLKPVLVSSTPSGLRIDLNTGHIDGYDLYLSGKGTNGSFILNSADETTPFKIGDNLSASWNGELFCQGVKYIGNVPKSGNYTINIGNGLKVNSSGGGYFSGTSEYANYAGYADKAGYAYSAYTATTATYATTAGYSEKTAAHTHTLTFGSGRIRVPATYQSYTLPSSAKPGSTINVPIG